jgi:ketosteroid isomerase-like protein
MDPGADMNRRRFIAAATLLTSTACRKTRPAAASGEAAKQVIADYYDLFYRRLDERGYRALLTDDYLLLENGEIFDANGDIASMPKAGDGYTRSDAFAFRTVQVLGDTAYVVYVLRSAVVEKSAARNLEWLESAILRRSGSRWKVALLHSTRIVKPSGAG